MKECFAVGCSLKFFANNSMEYKKTQACKKVSIGQKNARIHTRLNNKKYLQWKKMCVCASMMRRRRRKVLLPKMPCIEI